MSESENLPTPPPPSSPKTSAVPLKKETVRITLRARPGEGSVQPRDATSPVSPVTSGVAIPAPSAPKKATAPIQLPSAPLPPPAPKASTSPVKLPPPVAPSAPPAPSAVPPPPGIARPSVPGAPPAATVPMAPPSPPSMPRPPAPGGPPKIETGAATAPLAKTVPLKPMPAAPRVAGTGTGPMVSAPGAAPTGGLPKATVKLQQTQPMARPSISAPPSAPVKRTAGTDAEQFYNDDKDPEEGLVPLSVVCLLLSVVLLVLQMFGSDRVSAQDASPIMVPKPTPVKWEMLNEDHVWSNSFSKFLPQVPQ